MTKKKITAIYPGSFDPVTNGHIDIIKRSIKIFSKVIPAILVNPEKKPLFTVEERLYLLKDACKDLEGVDPVFFDGLLVDAAKKYGATVVIRGIRAVSDYEYELQMALMNRSLYEELETLFLVPAQEYSFLSSRLVKDVYGAGGDIKNFVTPLVAEKLREKFNR